MQSRWTVVDRLDRMTKKKGWKVEEGFPEKREGK